MTSLRIRKAGKIYLFFLKIWEYIMFSLIHKEKDKLDKNKATQGNFIQERVLGHRQVRISEQERIWQEFKEEARKLDSEWENDKKEIQQLRSKTRATNSPPPPYIDESRKESFNSGYNSLTSAAGLARKMREKSPDRESRKTRKSDSNESGESRISQLSNDVVELKSDVAGIKSDVTEIKQAVNFLIERSLKSSPSSVVSKPESEGVGLTFVMRKSFKEMKHKLPDSPASSIAQSSHSGWSLNSEGKWGKN